jgi:CDP-glucose 4,6-dehydratase
MHPLAAFYRGKRVLVTGHTGFQGGWLTAWLKLLGAKVSGYALPPATRPNFFDATLLDRGMTSIFGDIRDRNMLANTFAELQPEIVIHNSAQTLGPKSYSEPAETFAINAMGTVHVLEEARLTKSVGAIVIATSDLCYENRDWFWGHREGDPLGGHDPYTASKACAELAASAYLRTFFHETKTAVATARSGNVIGGGDWTHDRLIPDIVRAIISEKQITIRNGSVVHAWQHVLEPVRAYLLLAERLYESGQAYSGPWNFGPYDDNLKTVRVLAESFIKHWGTGEISFSSEDATAPGQEAVRLYTKKARTQLGWTPVLNFDETVAWATDWYRAFHADPASAWRTTEDQIDRYMRSAASQVHSMSSHH